MVCTYRNLTLQTIFEYKQFQSRQTIFIHNTDGYLNWNHLSFHGVSQFCFVVFFVCLTFWNWDDELEPSIIKVGMRHNLYFPSVKCTRLRVVSVYKNYFGSHFDTILLNLSENRAAIKCLFVLYFVIETSRQHQISKATASLFICEYLICNITINFLMNLWYLYLSNLNFPP